MNYSLTTNSGNNFGQNNNDSRSHEVGLVALISWVFGCLVVCSVRFGSVCCFRLFGTSFDFRSKQFFFCSAADCDSS